jgi:hypothetical protein
MPDPTHGLSASVSSARLAYEFTPDDDMLSIQRWLFYGVGTPNITAQRGVNLYIWGSIEGTFERPAITVKLLPGTREADFSLRRPVSSPQRDVQFMVALTAYHLDRARTVDLGRRVEGLLRDGSVNFRPLSIPMYSAALAAKVARSLRVLRPSIQMGIEDTDDEGKWSVQVTAAMTSPRLRVTPAAPAMDRVSTVMAGQ